MKFSSNVLLLTILIAPIVVILLLNRSILSLLNALFYMGLVLLIIGGSMLLIQEGFFKAFIRNSKKFYSTITKQQKVLWEAERRNESTHSYRKIFPYTRLFFLAGVGYCLFSLIGSALYIYLGK